jgi:hypothetical protein
MNEPNGSLFSSTSQLSSQRATDNEVESERFPNNCNNQCGLDCSRLTEREALEFVAERHEAPIGASIFHTTYSEVCEDMQVGQDFGPQEQQPTKCNGKAKVVVVYHNNEHATAVCCAMNVEPVTANSGVEILRDTVSCNSNNGDGCKSSITSARNSVRWMTGDVEMERETKCINSKVVEPTDSTHHKSDGVNSEIVDFRDSAHHNSNGGSHFPSDTVICNPVSSKLCNQHLALNNTNGLCATVQSTVHSSLCLPNMLDCDLGRYLSLTPTLDFELGSNIPYFYFNLGAL